MTAITCQTCRGSGEVPTPHAHPNRPATMTCRNCGGTGELDTHQQIEAEKDSGLDLYIARAHVACGGTPTDQTREIIGWCHSHPPKIGVEKMPCVHSWFAIGFGKFRCAHCASTLELP